LVAVLVLERSESFPQGSGIKDFQDLNGLSGREFDPLVSEFFVGFDDELTGGWVIIAVRAFGNVDFFRIAAAGHGEQNQLLTDYADPQRSLSPPSACVDFRLTLEA